MMATKTRAKPSRKRPVSSFAKGRLGQTVGKAKRGYAKTMKKHPWLSTLLQVLLGIVAVLALLLGVVLETSLYYLVMALAGLGTLAVRRAQQMERTRQGVPSKPTSAGPRTTPPPKPSSSDPKPAASGSIKCTRPPHKPIEECECASRHVASEKGVKKYGRPLGSPIGAKKPGTK